MPPDLSRIERARVVSRELHREALQARTPNTDGREDVRPSLDSRLDHGQFEVDTVGDGAVAIGRAREPATGDSE